LTGPQVGWLSIPFLFLIRPFPSSPLLFDPCFTHSFHVPSGALRRRGRGGGPSKSWLAPQIQPAPKLWLGPKSSCDQLTLRKISNFDATRCQILRLKCTKFDFRWGSAPDHAGRAYSAPPNLLAVFNGPTSNER